jgi:hypothetical protein
MVKVMRKTDKKLDKQIRLALTDVCETALKDVAGFQWLTHMVNYAHFPQSLKVVCVFDTVANLTKYQEVETNNYIGNLIQLELQSIGIDIKNPAKHVSYDTEEGCEQQHNGNWAARLSYI